MGKIDQTANINLISRISAGTTIKGEIISEHDLRIDGCFEGKLYSEGRVVIGENANVNGDVICTNVDLWGTMSGNLFVKDTLSLKEGCDMSGGLNVRKLFIELGSIFNGTCKMITEEEFKTYIPKAEPAAASKASSQG